jgi:hypothetical protein
MACCSSLSDLNSANCHELKATCDNDWLSKTRIDESRTTSEKMVIREKTGLPGIAVLFCISLKKMVQNEKCIQGSPYIPFNVPHVFQNTICL